ncbi:MAG: transcriptional regulator, TetR family [Pedosphaera sp.]|nr:transcriptional regulator, TetR family [Pedosphaera sp.]
MPPQPPEATAQDATRKHLLETAGEVFAEVGFRAATVREICLRAEANIAAVNYHFGDKERLYTAVLQDTCRVALETYPPNLGLAAKATPEQRLSAFVRSFLLRIFSEGPAARHGKLMAREMIEPTGALDDLVRENVQPMAAMLKSIVRSLVGPGASEETLRLCAMSVVSQVLFYHHCRPVVRRLYPDLKFGSVELEQLAEHITQFSLAAIKQLGKARKKRGGK